MAAHDHLGTQFEYPEDMATATSHQQYTFGRVHAAYGSNNLNTVFGETSQTAPAPWPSAGKTKKGTPWDREAVADALRRPPELSDVDPRNLHATQPSVVRHHAEYYTGGEYERTGATAADQGNVGNQYPVVYRSPDGRNLLLSGHHRATAALVQGRPLRARVVNPGARAATPDGAR